MKYATLTFIALSLFASSTSYGNASKEYPHLYAYLQKKDGVDLKALETEKGLLSAARIFAGKKSISNPRANAEYKALSAGQNKQDKTLKRNGSK